MLLRLVRRARISSSVTSKKSTASIRRPRSWSRRSTPSACGMVRTTPSKMTPLAASGLASCSRTIPMMISSLTRCPASITDLARRPSGVPRLTASRSRSPVANFGKPRASANRAPCVPFPAPGGPINRMSMLLQKSGERQGVNGKRGDSTRFRGPPPLTAYRAPLTRSLHIPLLATSELYPAGLHKAVVLPQSPVLLHLGNGIEQHAHHDQNRGPAELGLHPNPLRNQHRDQGNCRQ